MLEESPMSTQPLRHASATESARKAEAAPRDTVARPPSAETVAARLAGLTAADMPWLSKDTDLTPPDGGPEIVGPATYVPPPAMRGR